MIIFTGSFNQLNPPNNNQIIKKKTVTPIIMYKSVLLVAKPKGNGPIKPPKPICVPVFDPSLFPKREPAKTKPKPTRIRTIPTGIKRLSVFMAVVVLLDDRL
jgi:hypothetical protein